MRKLVYINIFMLVGLTYSYSQSASNDPIYDTVFVENFTDTVRNAVKWGTTYVWGPSWNNNTKSLAQA